KILGVNEHLFRLATVVCESASNLFGIIGVEEPKMLFDDLWKRADQITTLNGWVTGKKRDLRKFSFTSDRPEGTDEFTGPVKVAFVSYLVIGSYFVGFALELAMIPQVKPTSIVWKPKEMKPIDIRHLSKDPDSLSVYGDEMKLRCGAEGTITLQPEDAI
ncbi:MAG: hypothetical protein JO124_07585, partial [Hyphomicrobiales bacterium]|nr:hypothetical protein [Hyphomicrobiales bacterium]